MTSKVSFFNLIKENLKQRIGTIAFSILCCFVAWPLYLLIFLEYIKDFTKTEYEAYFIKFFGMNGFSIAIVITLAVICGMGGFSYLFSKTKIDFYHSLPVKREKLFLVSYINGFFIYFIPYVICIGICFVLSTKYIGISGAVLKCMMSNIMMNIVFFLFLYEVVILAVILTGNKISFFIMLTALFSYVIATKFIYMGYQGVFFDTFYTDSDVLLENIFTSPIAALIYGNVYFSSLLRNGNYGIDSHMLSFLLQCFIFIIGYGILELWLFKRRSSEAATRAIAFPIIQDIYRILLVIPIALGCGLFFCAITTGLKITWLLFGILFGLLLAHFLLETLFYMDIRKALSHKLQLTIIGGLLCLFAFSMRYDWWGYDTYLPKENSIKSMAIAIDDVHRMRYYMGAEGYTYGPQYVLENMNITDYEPIYEMAKNGVEHQKKKEYEEGRYTWCTIKYTLTNGKDVYRNYYLKVEDDLLEQIMNKEEYKNAVYQVLDFEAEDVSELRVSDIETDKVIVLEAKDIPEFFNTYKEELKGISFKEMKEYYPVAGMGIKYKDAWIENTMIYPSFTKTRNYLKDHGLETKDNAGSFEAEGIETMQVTVAEWALEEGAENSASFKDGYFVKTYTDAEDIKEICENLHPEQYQYIHNSALKGNINNYVTVYAQRVNEEGEMERLVGYYLNDEVPEIIKKDFEIAE